MCWIFAYIWEKQASNYLVNWLRNLEYRGYDSAWIACVSWKNDVYLEKATWKVSNLASKIEQTWDNLDKYNTWIAHTRWATHGWVSESNCHPHYSQNERFYVVHNWIIENYLDLKKQLQDKWYEFYSDTDSEVVAKLIEDSFEGDIESTAKKITKKLTWAYALAIIDRENPNTLVWAKIWSHVKTRKMQRENRGDCTWCDCLEK